MEYKIKINSSKCDENSFKVLYGTVRLHYLHDLIKGKTIKRFDYVSIKKIWFMPGTRYLLNSPNLSDRFSFRLALIGLFLGIISLIISVL